MEKGRMRRVGDFSLVEVSAMSIFQCTNTTVMGKSEIKSHIHIFPEKYLNHFTKSQIPIFLQIPNLSSQISNKIANLSGK